MNYQSSSIVPNIPSIQIPNTQTISIPNFPLNSQLLLPSQQPTTLLKDLGTTHLQNHKMPSQVKKSWTLLPMKNSSEDSTASNSSGGTSSIQTNLNAYGQSSSFNQKTSDTVLSEIQAVIRANMIQQQHQQGYQYPMSNNNFQQQPQPQSQQPSFNSTSL